MPLIELGKEECTEMVRTSSRNSLHADHTLFLECRGRRAENQFGSCTCKRSESSNWEVLVVKSFVIQQDVRSLEI